MIYFFTWTKNKIFSKKASEGNHGFYQFQLCFQCKKRSFNVWWTNKFIFYITFHNFLVKITWSIDFYFGICIEYLIYQIKYVKYTNCVLYLFMTIILITWNKNYLFLTSWCSLNGKQLNTIMNEIWFHWDYLLGMKNV